MSKIDYKGPIKGIVQVMRADSKYLGAEDLMAEQGDVCLLIDGVIKAENEEIAGKKTGQKFMLRLKTPQGKPCKKELVLNKTNLKTLILLYGGGAAEQWIGKPIWLGLDTCEAFGKRGVACVRVRNRKDLPRGAAAQVSDDHPTITPDPSQEGIVPGDAAE